MCVPSGLTLLVCGLWVGSLHGSYVSSPGANWCVTAKSFSTNSGQLVSPFCSDLPSQENWRAKSCSCSFFSFKRKEKLARIEKEKRASDQIGFQFFILIFFSVSPLPAFGVPQEVGSILDIFLADNWRQRWIFICYRSDCPPPPSPKTWMLTALFTNPHLMDGCQIRASCLTTESGSLLTLWRFSRDFWMSWLSSVTFSFS
jgi:hypothetical protein